MFNNVAFSHSTIVAMSDTPALKPSMKLLYETARQRDINNPAAVARKLGATQQSLKNWDHRGISKQGAMKAQAVFGLDSNTLLELDLKDAAAANLQPGSVPIRPLVAAEEGPKYVAKRESRDVWTTEAIKIMSSLKPAQREGAVATLRTYVHNLGPPEKRSAPAHSAATV